MENLRRVGQGYIPPDFIKISKAYGIKTMEIKNNSEFDNKIDELLKSDESIVVDVDCHDHHEYEPRTFIGKLQLKTCTHILIEKSLKAIGLIHRWMENPIMPKFIKSDEVGM